MKIYFYTDGYAIKVGTSKDEKRRGKELQTGNPKQLQLLGTMFTETTSENDIKRMLRPWRCAGGTEWFKGEEVLEFVADCLDMHVNYLKTQIKKPSVNAGPFLKKVNF